MFRNSFVKSHPVNKKMSNVSVVNRNAGTQRLTENSPQKKKASFRRMISSKLGKLKFLKYKIESFGSIKHVFKAINSSAGKCIACKSFRNSTEIR